jgi:hypothetical protein
MYTSSNGFHMTLLEKLADLHIQAPARITIVDGAIEELFKIVDVLSTCTSPGAATQAMKRLRKHVYEKIPPEMLTTVMRDYMTDKGMWEWVDAFDAAYLRIYDYEAAYWAVTSIAEISAANKVLEKRNVC